jgi:hypothetical protein
MTIAIRTPRLPYRPTAYEYTMLFIAVQIPIEAHRRNWDYNGGGGYPAGWVFFIE